MSQSISTVAYLSSICVDCYRQQAKAVRARYEGYALMTRPKSE
jgi:hypothetical protein